MDLPKKPLWHVRVKEEDPEKYAKHIEDMRRWYMEHYHGDPEYQQQVINYSREYRAKKRLDPEYLRKKRERDNARNALKRELKRALAVAFPETSEDSA